MRIHKSPFVKGLQQPKAKDNEIFLYDEIGYFGITAEEFIREFESIDSDEITVRINSPGGNVFEGNAIYESIRNHPAKITTQIDGIAASMASVIAMGGEQTKISDGGFLMIHDPWSIVIGNAEVFRKEADVLDKIGGSLAKAYVKKTGKSQDEIEKLMNEETWFNADEALDHGFVDEVMNEKPVQSSFDLSIFSNAPDLSTGPRLKEVEKFLRDAGMSRKEAKIFVANGSRALQRDADPALEKIANRIAKRIGAENVRLSRDP